MGTTTGIEWCDHIDLGATGRVLGSYKTAARRTGSSVEEWMKRRSAGLLWCFRCRAWLPHAVFAVDKSRRGRRASCCRRCTSEASMLIRLTPTGARG